MHSRLGSLRRRTADTISKIQESILGKLTSVVMIKS